MTAEITNPWPAEPLWPPPLELALSEAGWLYEEYNDGEFAGWTNPDDPMQLHFTAEAAWRALQCKRRAEAGDA